MGSTASLAIPTAARPAHSVGAGAATGPAAAAPATGEPTTSGRAITARATTRPTTTGRAITGRATTLPTTTARATAEEPDQPALRPDRPTDVPERLTVPEGPAEDRDGLAVDAAVRAVHEWLDQVEAVLSPFRPDSDLCRWRSGDAPLGSCSPLLAEVITDVDHLRTLTDGGFHPYDRRGRYDPTGYVKGWAVQRAVGILVGAGVADAALGVGGDIQTVGLASGGRPWRVAIADPADPGRILAIVKAPDGRPFAVATSGESQRGEHIWAALDGGPGREPARSRDPRPPEPGPGRDPARPLEPARSPLVSITVVGPMLGVADAFATAIWAHCRNRPIDDAWAWLAGTGYDALAVAQAGHARTTAGMTAHLIQPGTHRA